MRKVKFTQDSFDEKLSAILEEFPMLDVRFTNSYELGRVRFNKGCTGHTPIPVFPYERAVR